MTKQPTPRNPAWSFDGVEGERNLEYDEETTKSSEEDETPHPEWWELAERQ
jgi:hypothetical protein